MNWVFIEPRNLFLIALMATIGIALGKWVFSDILSSDNNDKAN